MGSGSSLLRLRPDILHGFTCSRWTRGHPCQLPLREPSDKDGLAVRTFYHPMVRTSSSRMERFFKLMRVNGDGPPRNLPGVQDDEVVAGWAENGREVYVFSFDSIRLQAPVFRYD